MSVRSIHIFESLSPNGEYITACERRLPGLKINSRYTVSRTSILEGLFCNQITCKRCRRAYRLDEKKEGT